jgi:hypothetical protein
VRESIRSVKCKVIKWNKNGWGDPFVNSEFHQVNKGHFRNTSAIDSEVVFPSGNEGFDLSYLSNGRSFLQDKTYEIH